MFSNWLLKVSIASLLLNMSFFSHSQGESKTSPFDTTKSCFRAPFSSYDEWLEMVSKSSAKRFKKKEKIKQSIASFKKRFNRETFDKFEQLISCITFLYKSGDTTVEGFVIKPKNITNDLPVIIYNRGGNGNYGRVIFARMIGTLFPIAEQGFVIVGSQYRRAFKHSEPKYDDEFGGADVQDVVNLAELIPAIKGADANRVGMLGASRGAMQSYMALRAGVDVSALVTIAGAVDLKATLAFRPKMENVFKKRIPNYQTHKSSALKARSALHWIDELDPKLPILLIHGERDKRVGAFQSVNMANKLKELARPNRLIIYPDDNHDLKLNRVGAYREVVEWFKKYL